MGAGAVKSRPEEDPDQNNLSSTQQSVVQKNKCTMSCEACSTEFTFFSRKRLCADCNRPHCTQCVVKEPWGSSTRRRCKKCRLLASGNFTRKDLMEFKVKDLKSFLTRRNISMQNCMEKADFVEAILKYSNNAHYRQELEEKERHLRELQERRRLNASRATNNSADTASIGSHGSSYQPSPQPSPATTSRNPQPESQPMPPPPPSQPQDPTSVPSTNDIELEAPYQPWPPAPPPYEEVERARAAAEGSANQDAASGSHVNVEQATEVMADSEEQAAATETVAGSIVTQSQESQQPPVRASLDHVKDVSEIEDLTVRQLKEILATNFVDYKGCCEKWELMERVKRLWHSDRGNKQKAQEIDEETANNKAGPSSSSDKPSGSSTHLPAQEGDMCKICMDAMIDCVLLECGHMVTCTRCGKRMAECPICRQYVSRVVHIFKA